MTRLGALALGVLLAAGCKKPAEVVVQAPKPTATPVTSTDIVGFTRAGALWICKVDGSEQRPLAAPGKGQAIWFPMASPDGSHFVAWLSRPNGTQDVVRIELNGRITQLTDIGEDADPAMKNMRLGNAPSYSPDGKRIAYAFNGNLWVMDANGYNAETLISDGASWAPCYSPDGKHIAYVNGDRSRYDLWVTDVDSHDTYQVSDFAGYTVGRPQWSSNGQRLMLTRSQGDESDIVILPSAPDAPLADADVLTKDHQSAGAVFSPSGTNMLFSSGRAGNGQWNLYGADATGSSPKQLTNAGGLAPAWMRPSSFTAMVFDNGPSRPTPVAAPAAPAALPTAVTAALPNVPVQMPVAAPTPMPMAAAAPAKTAGASAVPAPLASAKPTPPAAAAGAVHPVKPSGAVPPQPKPAGSAAAQAQETHPAPAPTQPPLKAAPLRLRYRASFDAKDGLSPAALADLKKLAPRVRQYASEQVTVIGPLDTSALKGKYASNEARSKARAQAVGAQLAKLSGIQAGQIQAQPYSPPTSSAGAQNSILIYVELK